MLPERCHCSVRNIITFVVLVLASKKKLVKQKEFASANIDPTVQEKNITYPTGAKLCFRAIEKPGIAAM